MSAERIRIGDNVYVTDADHQALQAELERVEAERDEKTRSCRGLFRNAEGWERDCKAREAELDELAACVFSDDQIATASGDDLQAALKSQLLKSRILEAAHEALRGGVEAEVERLSKWSSEPSDTPWRKGRTTHMLTMHHRLTAVLDQKAEPDPQCQSDSAVRARLARKLKEGACETCGGSRKLPARCTCRPGLDGDGYHHEPDCASYGDKPCPDCTTGKQVEAAAHEGERCEDCGEPYELVWWCHDPLLWEAVTGKQANGGEPAGGTMCVSCFDRKARELCPWIEWAPLNLGHLLKPEIAEKVADARHARAEVGVGADGGPQAASVSFPPVVSPAPTPPASVDSSLNQALKEIRDEPVTGSDAEWVAWAREVAAVVVNQGENDEPELLGGDAVAPSGRNDHGNPTVVFQLPGVGCMVVALHLSDSGGQG